MQLPRVPHGPDSLRLPADVSLRALVAHVDSRGTVAEMFRAEWPTGIAPVQWTVTRTRGDVLRGVHVHLRHDDYLCVLQGRLTCGLRDLRPGSPTQGLTAALDLRADDLAALFIPHGVAHGFYAPASAVYVLGTSHYYDPADELGCHWTDPDVELSWPSAAPAVSARDDALPPLRELLPLIPRWQPA